MGQTRDRWFEARQIVIRGPGQTIALPLSRRLQIGFVVLLGAVLAGVAGTSGYAALQRHRADAVARKMDRVLDAARAEAERAAEERQLLVRLGQELRHRLSDQQGAAAAEIRDLLDQREAAIDRALADRAAIVAERDRARAERDAALAVNRDTLARIEAETRDTIASVEKIIRATGLDADQLLLPVSRDEKSGPKGGPFVPWPGGEPGPADATGAADRRISFGMERLRLLRILLEHVPLRSPVIHTEISSRFGYRRDPITGAAALHPGVDLRGRLGTPIFATAQGVVVQAGWEAAYGRTVEIDHGFGLLTRFAHLSKILVGVGDTVSLAVPIGLMGATGRATGVHLHYEVRLDGHVLNPSNFLKADHDVHEEDSSAAERRADDEAD